MPDDQHIEAAPARSDFTVKKGDVSLAVYRKRLEPERGAPARPVLFLVHGSSNSGLSSFDLTVPGKGEYSTMNVFARLGFDVWTMDHENYGRSSRTEGNSDIASGVADLIAATDLVVRETGEQRLHFMGESSGALRAAAFAMARPERVDRLVLNAFTYTWRNSPTLAKRAE
jgi:pimeloyl-ACP methyl ester carboxylesterase